MRGDLAQGLSSQEAPAWEELYARALGAPPPDGARAALALEDRWILQRIADASLRLEDAIAGRRLNDAALIVYDCFWHDYCDWYLEALKPRLTGADPAARRTALLHALLCHALLLRMLHPFLPFLTEELWSLHPATAGFCMVAPIPRFDALRGGGAGPRPVLPGDDVDRFDLARELVSAARTLRSEFNVPPGRRGSLLLQAEPSLLPTLQSIGAHVELLAKMESVQVGPAGRKPARAVGAVVQGVEVYLPVEGLVDLGRQKDRLHKEREGLQRRLLGIRAKLSNESFVAKAPPEVVQQQRDVAGGLEQTLAKLEQQLAALE
jgi:valyl-tRNA synthetase